MSAKLPPDKKRTKSIRIPVNTHEKRIIKELAKARGVSDAQVMRELARREYQTNRERSKKAKAA